ncbi:MAG TPA: hypothetical protein VFO34_03015 [Candidatus Acidoferrales bacterium]|nr:hypothetical protein [Candidatus Acidoferrales bacterium]
MPDHTLGGQILDTRSIHMNLEFIREKTNLFGDTALRPVLLVDERGYDRKDRFTIARLHAER